MCQNRTARVIVSSKAQNTPRDKRGARQYFFGASTTRAAFPALFEGWAQRDSTSSRSSLCSPLGPLSGLSSLRTL